MCCLVETFLILELIAALALIYNASNGLAVFDCSLLCVIVSFFFYDRPLLYPFKMRLMVVRSIFDDRTAICISRKRSSEEDLVMWNLA